MGRDVGAGGDDARHGIAASRGTRDWRSNWSQIWLQLLNSFGLLIIIVAIGIVLSQASDVFLTKTNIANVLFQSTILAVIAIGQTFVIIVRGIDLSVGSLVALSSVLAVGLTVNNGYPTWLAIVAALVVGVGFGLFNGLSVSLLGIPPLIVTLATLSLASGFAFIYSDGQSIFPVQPIFTTVGSERIWGFSVLIPFVLALGLFAQLVLSRTRFGRSLFALGGNPVAAQLSGIRTRRVIVGAFVISGFSAALGGLLLTSRLQTGTATGGTGIELTVIAAVIIGGTSLFGGEGSIVGTLLGVLLLGLVQNAIDLLSVPPNWDVVVQGAVIFTAATIDIYRRRYARELSARMRHSRRAP